MCLCVCVCVNLCNRKSVAKAGEVIVTLLFYMGLFMWCVNMCEKEGDRVGVFFFVLHCVYVLFSLPSCCGYSHIRSVPALITKTFSSVLFPCPQLSGKYVLYFSPYV